MANATSKKQLIFLVLTLIFSFSSFAQKKGKLKEFSKEFPTYLQQLNVFMTASDNSELKKVFKSFSKSESSFSVSEKEKIIAISNKMLDKRLRAKPHFSNFLSSLMIVNKHVKGESMLPQWLAVVDETADNTTTKKLMLFCAFTDGLVKDNTLRSSRSASWKVNTNDYQFDFEMIEPIVFFNKDFNLSCTADGGSYAIEGTRGKYYFISNEWQGKGGIINWEIQGLDKDSVYAIISDYNVDTRKSQVVADSVVFYNKYIFPSPIIGQVINKVAKGKQAEMYPEFTSYSKDVELKEVFRNIDYRGGYKMQGKEFIADGGDYAEARIIFKRNSEEIFIANADRFTIGSDRIVSEGAGIKIFFDNDSIYHGNLQFKYIDSKRQLQLYRDINGLSGAPMLNTYHNVTMGFELLEWNIDGDIITFGSLPGTAESRVAFESVDMYLKEKYESMQGIDAIHPLLLVNNYVRAKQEEKFYVEDFAHFARFPLTQIQHYLIQLANDGFIFYDFVDERIMVLPKLYNYVNAASDLGDYDVIAFNSVISPGEYKTSDKYLVNAALNLTTKDLNILGIHNIELSKERAVYLRPEDGLLVVKKNRDFIFNGQIYAGGGRLNLFGREFLFHYDEFKVDLNHIDSVQLSVPIQPIQKDMYGNELLTTVKTVIEAVNGDLRIDHPTNKSGIRKDSFPEFPIFRSFEDSYAYYDKSSIYDGVFARDRFSFHLQPFEIDSLDNYSTKGLWFAGTFESANIFPTFDDTLRVQDDYSLGFTRNTPADGFAIYGGKGKYYNDIHLSHKGLKGNGDFEYLTSKASADEILFFPDSANLYTQSFSIIEVQTGIEFPDVKNSETYAHFEPYNDRLTIDALSEGEEFELYNTQATFSGSLLLRPTGLIGAGIMSLDKAKVSSNLFTYNANWFEGDTTTLRVFDDGANEAIKANNIKSHIDLVMREGTFYSNGPGSFVEFPANQYISYIDQLQWAMDEESFILGDDKEGGGSRFISLKDSLSFIAKTADYSLKDYVIHAAGINEISIADAIIYPDSGLLTLEKDGVIQTLHNSSILVDDLTEYHTFTNAIIDIKSKTDYSASGDYTYKDIMNNEQYIFFNEISVNEDTITIARGDIENDKPFKIGNKFDFKGSVEILSSKRNLIFDGYFMANHDCKLIDKEWVKFYSDIDPKNIQFTLEDKIFNDSEDLLSTGLVWSFDSTNFYSTFLSEKKRKAIDVDVLSASHTLKYDEKQFAYLVGEANVLSNSYTLYDKTCTIEGEGVIDLNLNLGQIQIKTVANITHDMKSLETEIEGFLMLDFFCSIDAMKKMKDEHEILMDYAEEISYDKSFKKNYIRAVGEEERAGDLLYQLEVQMAYDEFPNELKNTIVFTKTKLIWDNEQKTYASKGPIGIHSILDQRFDYFVNGYITIEKGRISDVLTIYLDMEDEIYYFYYKNGVMRAWSTNFEFNDAITAVSDKKRKADRVKGSPYRYMLASEDAANKFKRAADKKYKN